jgi:hypothetical protein
MESFPERGVAIAVGAKNDDVIASLVDRIMQTAS